MNLFEPELICEANLSFADNTRSAMDFGSSGELRISGIHLRLRRGSWLAVARTALRRTQVKIAAGDIRSEGPVDFDICDQGTLSHQKLTKADFGTSAKIATSVRVKDLPSTAARSIRIGLRQIPTSRQANAKSISFEATSCRMLLGHAFAQYWDEPAANLDGRGKPRENIFRQWNESDCAELTRRIASTTFRARYHLSLLQGAG